MTNKTNVYDLLNAADHQKLGVIDLGNVTLSDVNLANANLEEAIHDR